MFYCQCVIVSLFLVRARTNTSQTHGRIAVAITIVIHRAVRFHSFTQSFCVLLE